MALTELKLRSLKPNGSTYRTADGEGLYLLVKPSGAKTWRFDYRFGNRRNTLTFGSYPHVSLKKARGRKDEARELLAAGKDPAIERERQQQAEKADAASTFAALSDEYIDRLIQQGCSPATLKKNRWLLEVQAVDLRPMAMRSITAHDILRIIKRIEASGRIDTAHSVRGVISSVFRMAVATLRADTDPTFALRGALTPNNPTSHPAITDQKEFGVLLSNVDAYDGWASLRAALQIMALCFPRPIELRKSRWEHFDLERAEWLIPAKHTKMRRDHIIPLSRQVIAIVKGLKEWASGDLVFASIRNSQRPLSENAMNSALRRMGYLGDEHTSHGFRSSASTILNGRRFHSDVIEAALAHLDPNEVRRVYNRYTYWEERVDLMQKWADICDGLKAPKKRNNSDLI